MAISPAQCRAARALLGWSQDELAQESKVAKATIANFEAGKRTPYGRTLDDLVGALDRAGVLFIPENGGGAGLRLKKHGALADDHPKPEGPATDAVDAMDKAIKKDRGP